MGEVGGWVVVVLAIVVLVIWCFGAGDCGAGHSGAAGDGAVGANDSNCGPGGECCGFGGKL